MKHLCFLHFLYIFNHSLFHNSVLYIIYITIRYAIVTQCMQSSNHSHCWKDWIQHDTKQHQTMYLYNLEHCLFNQQQQKVLLLCMLILVKMNVLCKILIFFPTWSLNVVDVCLVHTVVSHVHWVLLLLPCEIRDYTDGCMQFIFQMCTLNVDLCLTLCMCILYPLCTSCMIYV